MDWCLIATLIIGVPGLLILNALAAGLILEAATTDSLTDIWPFFVVIVLGYDALVALAAKQWRTRRSAASRALLMLLLVPAALSSLYGIWSAMQPVHVAY